ncbi:cupin domain-containing protein [Flavobacteriaceae bacterium F89]|uniref:Cupin domain-containing protein n=1 Tax=Cerina litoralis TaxID=2874477 RepID=A0AAE3EU33_9FLAO|nr:cupin domain-containing protein [Cerina litoralis]MCG2460988.1 cupin domain-containing protein [Cerina litoralis]
MKNLIKLSYLILSLATQSIVYGQNTDPKKGIMPEIKLVSARDVQEKLDGKPARVSTVELTYAPQASSAPHRHPGPVYGYVLQGTFEFKVAGEPLQRLRAGETFYEPTMILHEVSRNPSDSEVVKVLAVVVHPRDAERLVIPEKQ